MTNTLAAVAPVPVRTIPLPIWSSSAPTPFSRQQLGMPDGFVFYFSYDFESVLDRKNPMAVIDAYVRAFGPDDGATLVLKSINGQRRPIEVDRVRHGARGRRDIVMIDAYLDNARNEAMLEQCDCFVSLHRSEGFGLNLANAMAAGKPVIATAYSGNMQFMDEASALLVPYHLVPVGPGNLPYPEDARWADPDLDSAAAHMRAVFDDRDYGINKKNAEAITNFFQ